MSGDAQGVLLPCPFCGGKSDFQWHSSPECWIECSQCGAVGPNDGDTTTEQNVAAWQEADAVVALANDAIPIIDALHARIAELEAWIDNPPRHVWWGAGEPDCPKHIKARNGELHTLLCKSCGLENPKADACQAAIAKWTAS